MFWIRVEILDSTLFPVGWNYFEYEHRMFAGDKPENRTVLVHNNWITGYENKIYRFKEHLMWYPDMDGYYSSIKSKYIVFGSSWALPSKKQEARALENAFFLGHILKRTVILPKFFCSHCHKKICSQIPGRNPDCAAHVHYNIRDLDKMFGGKYREHVFLQNPTVPTSVKESMSPVIFFGLNKPGSQTLHSANELGHNEPLLKKCDGSNLPNCSVSAPFDAASHPVKTETLKAWLETFSHYSVLRFQHLCGNIVNLESDTDFKKKLADGVKFNWYFRHMVSFYWWRQFV